MTAATGGPREWPADLDVPALVAQGWRRTPFDEFVVKVHSRCDLACDYCYMYPSNDPSWRSLPRVMATDLVELTCDRIVEHVTAHGLARIGVRLHGGEPLLAGPELIGGLAARLRRRLPAEVRLDLQVQTNATRLDEEMLATLARHRIRVGVSLDGDRRANDRHRRHPDGRGSFDVVRANLRRLVDRHPDLFAGLLGVVDLRNDPVQSYQALLEFHPPAVDFLLPHGTWSAPPPRPEGTGSTTPYGDWLVAVFERWYAAPRRETVVRLLAEIIQLLLGGTSRTEIIGLGPVTVVVVNTDGTLEQVDTLRASYPGAVGTGLNVREHPFDAALDHPGVVARQIGVAALADTCRACHLHRVCGGGYYPHRYRPGTGFRNPSVYCADLQRLITHLHRRVHADLLAAGAGC